MIRQIYHSEELRLRRITTRSIELNTVSKHLNFFNRKAPFDAGNNKLNAYQIGYSDQTVYICVLPILCVHPLADTMHAWW